MNEDIRSYQVNLESKLQEIAELRFEVKQLKDKLDIANRTQSSVEARPNLTDYVLRVEYDSLKRDYDSKQQ